MKPLDPQLEAVKQLTRGVPDKLLLRELISRAEAEADSELTRALLFVVRLLDYRTKQGRKVV